jgi:hypothetical protein
MTITRAEYYRREEAGKNKRPMSPKGSNIGAAAQEIHSLQKREQ